MPGLTASDFRAEFRGKPVAVHAAEMHTRPIRVVIALDRSSSMRDTHGAWQMAREAVTNLVTAAPAHVSFSLLAFGGGPSRSLVAGTDRATILKMLAILHEEKESGAASTALLDTLREALDLIPSPHAGDLVYAVTDGADNSSRTPLAALEQAYLERGVRAFAFLGPFPLALSSEVRPQEVAGPLQLADLADRTGGGVFAPDPFPADRVISARNLAVQMVQFYELQIELPQAVDKKRGWKLTLARSKDLGRPTLVYPQSLVPCPQRPPS